MKGLVAAVLLVSMPLHADTVDDPLHRARELYQRGDFVHAREQLLLAYQLAPNAELLFALGQVEFNLGNYDAAVRYYERFLATDPSGEQTALAQQAIGAARARLRVTQPSPTRVPTPGRRHRWVVEDTGIVVLGGAAIALGAGLIYGGYALSRSGTGTLSEYDDRIDYARSTQRTGFAIGTAGVLAIGAAVLHWRIGTETVEVRATASATAAGVALVRPW